MQCKPFLHSVKLFGFSFCFVESCRFEICHLILQCMYLKEHYAFLLITVMFTLCAESCTLPELSGNELRICLRKAGRDR